MRCHGHTILPWCRIPSDGKRRARLNLISHLLEQIPYAKVKPALPKMPKPEKPPANATTTLRTMQTVPNRY